MQNQVKWGTRPTGYAEGPAQGYFGKRKIPKQGSAGSSLLIFSLTPERDLCILEQGRRVDEPYFSLPDQDRCHYANGDGQYPEQAEKKTDEQENRFRCHSRAKSPSESKLPRGLR